MVKMNVIFVWTIDLRIVSRGILSFLVISLNFPKCEVSSFNIDWHSPIIIKTVGGSFGGRSLTPDYFGASIAFLKTSDSPVRIIIGAPKANSSDRGSADHLKIPEPGVIWQCTLGGKTTDVCAPIVMDPAGNVKYGDFQEWKNNSLLGGPDGLAVSGGSLVACQSRLEFWQTTTKTISLMNGGCLARPTSTLSPINPPGLPPPARSLDTWPQHMVPLNDTKLTSSEYKRNAQAGFSLHISKSGKDLIMGAPGLEKWRGSVAGYGRNSNQDEFTKRFITAPYTAKNSNIFNYFGYAVSSGNFYGGSDIYYVSGAPRANNLTGNVIVFQVVDFNNVAQINEKQELRGGQTGAYFGSSLLSLDVNGDGIDDLIVGSPRQTYRRIFRPRRLTGSLVDKFVGGNEDEGAVFIYFGSQQFGSRQPSTLYGNKKPLAQFGATLASLGDINKDGLNDFVVSAPYEGTSGAIYIYHGSRDNTITEQQVIYGHSIDPNLRGFGFSLASDVDIDLNGFNDLAIGSASASTVVVLRSSPIVTLHSNITAPFNKIPLPTKSFDVICCVSFTQDGYENSGERIGVLVHLEADVRLPNKRVKLRKKGDFGAKPNGSVFYEKNIVKGPPECVIYTALVVEELETSGAKVEFRQTLTFLGNSKSDEVKPRTLEINSETGNSIAKGENFSQFCSNCPVVNSKESVPSELALPLAVPCGDDDKCDSDLRLNVSFEEITQVSKGFKVGSKNTLGMIINLSNHNETAIQPEVRISWQKLTLTREPAGCSRKKSEDSNTILYSCTFGKFLERDKSVTVRLDFDVKSLAAMDVNGALATERLLWNVAATTVSDMSRPVSQSIVLPVIYEADMSIEGSRLFESLNLALRSEDQAKYVVFLHLYDVNVRGVSPVAGLQATFKLPVNITTENSTIINVRGVSSMEAFSCSPTVGEFSKNDDAISLDLGTAEESVSEDVVSKGGIGGVLTKEKDIVRKSNSSLVENGELLVHCDSPFVECMEVKCTAKNVLTSQDQARISFIMDIAIDDIKQLLVKHGVSAIKVESQGKLLLSQALLDIQPSPNEPDESVAVTLIEKESFKPPSKWIYVLSVVIGIIVLLCIFFCLYSCGCCEDKHPPELDHEQVPMVQKISDEDPTKNEGEDEQDSKTLIVASPLSPFSDVSDPPEFVPNEPTIPEEPEYNEIEEMNSGRK